MAFESVLLDGKLLKMTSLWLGEGFSFPHKYFVLSSYKIELKNDVLGFLRPLHRLWQVFLSDSQVLARFLKNSPELALQNP